MIDSPPPSATCWRPASTPPDPLVDVLLNLDIAFLGEEDRDQIAIGYLDRQGRWVNTYGCRLDGGDDYLDSVTHWAPLPTPPERPMMGFVPQPILRTEVVL